MLSLRSICALTVVVCAVASTAVAQTNTYRVLATTQGFEAIGMTVGKTAIGGAELVVITRRRAQ